MFDARAQKNILIVMLQIFDNLFHYKHIVTVLWIKRLKLCMVTMATLPPAKELKIQVVSWQNAIRTLDVLKSPTWLEIYRPIGCVMLETMNAIHQPFKRGTAIKTKYEYMEFNIGTN